MEVEKAETNEGTSATLIKILVGCLVLYIIVSCFIQAELYNRVIDLETKVEQYMPVDLNQGISK